MSRVCMVVDCSSSEYKLNRWMQEICPTHDCVYGHKPNTNCLCKEQPCLSAKCDCPSPFVLFNFPTERSNPTARSAWIKAVGRSDPGRKHLLLQPKSGHRICSEHFSDGCPTQKHPYPEHNLGYTPKPVKKRRLIERTVSTEPTVNSSPVTVTVESVDVSEVVIPVLVQQNAPSFTDTLYNNLCQFSFFLILLLSHVLVTNIFLHFYTDYLCKENQKLKNKILSLNTEVTKLKSQLEKCKRKDALYNKLLKSDSNVTFFTGLPSVEVFKTLHDYVVPFVRRRWHGLKVSSNVVKKLFLRSPKKFGPSRKLSSEDELLLTLMRLRLGLLNKDLASRFNISDTLCQKIFHGWLTAMNKTIGHLVYWPSKEEVCATKPARYRNLPDLRSIIDCSEVFIETPKNPDLQSMTWSEYKHHNTVKFLVSVSPNSMITYISPCYGGRLSDKKLTVDCGFLDMVDNYDMIEADKGFNISEECAARFISLHIPPGKRGVSQMSIAAVNKTKRVANLRILVEQVIRRLKTFRIIQGELPITLVPHVDKILHVCAALCNLKKPIYVN